MDLNFLAEETLRLTKTVREDHFSSKEFEEFKLNSKQEIVDRPIERAVPTGPGIIYYLDLGEHTFCVRGIPSENLPIDMKKKDILELFQRKMAGKNKLGHFLTQNFGTAQIVCEQIVNRRFPYSEDSLRNISDSGPNWWLRYGESSLEIRFKSRGEMASSGLINIGPIGDSIVAQRRWEQVSTYFKFNLMSNFDYKCNTSGLSIKFNGRGKTLLDDLVDLFQNGINNFSLSDFKMGLEAETLYLYFSELANTRRFWLSIEEELLVATS